MVNLGLLVPRFFKKIEKHHKLNSDGVNSRQHLMYKQFFVGKMTTYDRATYRRLPLSF